MASSSSNAPNSRATTRTLDTNDDSHVQHQSTAIMHNNAPRRGAQHLSCLIHLNNQQSLQANHHHLQQPPPSICVISAPVYAEQSLDDRDELANNGGADRINGAARLSTNSARRPGMRFVRQLYRSLRHINNYVCHHHHCYYYAQSLTSPLFDSYAPQIAINRPLAAANTSVIMRPTHPTSIPPNDSMAILLRRDDERSIIQRRHHNRHSEYRGQNSQSPLESSIAAECPSAAVDAAESPTTQVVMFGEESGGSGSSGDHRRRLATQTMAISPTAAATRNNPRSAALALHHNESETQTTSSPRTSARDACLSCGQDNCLGSCSDEIFTFKEGATDNLDPLDASQSEMPKTTNEIYSDVPLLDAQKSPKTNSKTDHDTQNDTKSINPGECSAELSNLYNKYDERYEMYESLAKRSEALYFQFWYSHHADNKSNPESVVREKPEELGNTILSPSSRSASLFSHNSNLYKSPWDYLLTGGSTYRGEQSPSGKCHDVSVTFKDCDLANDYCCGYLTIKGLTFDYPILTTFFEGEIIGNRYEFLTKKWQATYETDFKHWSKFKEFEQYKERFAQGTLDTGEIDRNDCLFMRWKEKFLVPCHQINSIPGASFAGFYYICLRRSKPSIFGFYYHQTSEWFQSLELEYIDTRTSGTYKFL